MSNRLIHQRICSTYRNFHFIYAGYRVAWIIPLLGGVRGGFLGRENISEYFTNYRLTYP